MTVNIKDVNSLLLILYTVIIVTKYFKYFDKMKKIVERKKIKFSKEECKSIYYKFRVLCKIKFRECFASKSAFLSNIYLLKPYSNSHGNIFFKNIKQNSYLHVYIIYIFWLSLSLSRFINFFAMPKRKRGNEG